MKRNFFWQPEAATAIIYWSLTMIVLFYSLIMALENTRPYWKSNLVLGVFGILIYLGLRRKIVTDNTQITIYYARIWKKRILLVGDINSICIEGRKLTISSGNDQWTAVFRKKDLVVLTTFLSEKTSLTIISSEDEKNCQSNDDNSLS